MQVRAKQNAFILIMIIIVIVALIALIIFFIVKGQLDKKKAKEEDDNTTTTLISTLRSINSIYKYNNIIAPTAKIQFNTVKNAYEKKRMMKVFRKMQ